MNKSKSIVLICDRTYIVDGAQDSGEEIASGILHIKSYLMDDHQGVPRIRLNYVDGSSELNVGHPYTIVEDVEVVEESSTE